MSKESKKATGLHQQDLSDVVSPHSRMIQELRGYLRKLVLLGISPYKLLAELEDVCDTQPTTRDAARHLRHSMKAYRKIKADEASDPTFRSH
jgi:hypothetical protein